MLHLIPEWRVAVDEAVRVLRRGGTLVASFPGGARAGLQARDASQATPWAAALRESLRRHGIERAQAGARDPGALAGHLAGRATARQLAPVTVTQTRTLAHALASMERQIYSWTWPFSAEQMRAVGADVRAWAARENVQLDAGVQVRSELAWWAFDLTR